MAYKFSFADNEIYSSSDVNEITKRLVTSGVEDTFADGVPYNLSRFNDLGKLLYTSGVVPENYAVLKVSKINDTEILINPGLAFFNDGATIEIEAGGEVLPYVSGSKNYVYLKNELVDKNMCYPHCGTDEPTGDFVLLAEIDEKGIVSDKRTYARGKLGGYQSVAGNALFFKETMELTVTSPLNASGDAEYDIGNNNFNYIIFTNLTEGNPAYPNLSLYRISDGKTISFTKTIYASESAFRDTGDIWTYISETKEVHLLRVLSFNDGILKVNAGIHRENGKYGDPGDKTTINLNLIFI